MEWMQTAPRLLGIGTGEWLSEVGFVPHKGSSMGVIADLFLEFHAGCIAAAYLIGHLYSLIWQRSGSAAGSGRSSISSS